VGTALGKYQLQLRQDAQTPLLPGLQAVVHAVQALPEEDRRASAELQAMVELAPRLAKTGPVAFLAKVLRPCRGFQPLDEQAVLYDLNRALSALDGCLQEWLKTFVGSVPPRPRWDGQSRELWFGDTLCRRYTRRAPRQERVLEAFERLGWPQRIPNPVPEGSLADTVKDLQDSVRDSPIMFERDGTGKGITWRRRPPP
jgi:hypothetical protein